MVPRRTLERRYLVEGIRRYLEQLLVIVPRNVQCPLALAHVGQLAVDRMGFPATLARLLKQNRAAALVLDERAGVAETNLELRREPVQPLVDCR